MGLHGKNKNRWAEPSLPTYFISFGAFRILLPHGLGEGAEGLLLLAVQGGGDGDPDGDELVAPAPAIHRGDTLAPEAEHRPRLGALGHGVFHISIDGGDHQLGSQGGLGEGDGMFIVDRRAVPLEFVAGAHGDRDEQIARRAAVDSGSTLPPAGMETVILRCFFTCPLPLHSLQGWWMIFPAPRQRVQGAVVEKVKAPPPRWMRITPEPRQSGQVSALVPGAQPEP